MPKSFTVNQIKGLKGNGTQYELFENTELRGTGRLGLRVGTTGTKTFIFRYFFDKKRRFLTLGKFGEKTSELTLMKARRLADELSQLVLEDRDPKVVIAEQEKALKVKTKQLNSRGTLQQLLESYVIGMKDGGKRTYRAVESAFLKEVLAKLDHSIPAADVPTSDFVRILAEMIDRGATTQSNRVRSYLHAAYRFGMQLDNNPRHRKRGLRFDIQHNPISAIPKQSDAERALTRHLSFEEMEMFFDLLPNVNRVGTQMVLVLKLCVFLGGQRPYEVMGTPWSSIDLDRREFVIPAEVSKNKKLHLVPLSSSAIKILRSLKELNPNAAYPTKSSTNINKPVRSDSLSHVVTRFRKEHPNFSPFTPRDLRRTCKTLMGTLLISKTDRDKLQNHTLNDVSSKHYDHYDYYEEKKSAIEKWERKLQRYIKV